MRILVTGAAGFIGSVVTEQLAEQGHEVWALDDLRHGHREAVDPRARLVVGDVCEREWLRSFMLGNPVDAVVHLAAEALIDESVRNPGRFFDVNVIGGLNLLDAMVAAGVRRLIFSSTAAVYGEPQRTPIDETDPCVPVNSYGESKLAFERALPWYRRAHGLECIAFRYFNACGASVRYGEVHVPETHLIPILFEVALGQRDAVRVFGTDYDTADGTCIRDYVHVSDIAAAHLLALAEIDRVGSHTFNIGSGSGFSNQAVIDVVRRVTGHPIPAVPAPRRPGDPARLVACPARVVEVLGWKPTHPDLADMVETAWAWRRNHPKGYSR